MKTIQRNTVVGIFENAAHAREAVNELRAAGFRDDQIGVASHDREAKAATVKSDDTHADTGALTGALAGAGIGAAWGLGIAAGLLPAIGPVIAGGTLAAILASAGVGAAAAGLAGALIGLGIPEEEATYYETEFKAGRTIVSVKADDRYDAVATILRKHHAHVQERTGAFRRADFAAAAPAQCATAVGATGHYASRSAEGQTIQRKEEELHARKENVKAGEVKVRKEVVTENKTITVPVEREEVVIERHAVSGGRASSSTLKPGEEVRIAVKEEQVHVEKTPVVKEEITVG